MKDEIIKIIKISGIDIKELVMDIVTDNYKFHSIELVDNDVILHTFIDDELDIETNWDDIPYKNQLEIINIFRPYVYN